MPVIESGFAIKRLHEPRPTRDFERTDLKAIQRTDSPTRVHVHRS